MSDPLEQGVPINVSSTKIANLKFAKLHSPKMKSIYWRHFGFPTNEQDRIITKQNVVCTLCHKVLTNHGNTTNLRAHLQHRHKDVFSKMCAENDIKVPPRRPNVKAYANAVAASIRRKMNPVKREIKVEYQDSSQDAMRTVSMGGDDQAMLYETMVPMTYEDDEVIDSDHFAKVEVGGNEMKQNSNVVEVEWKVNPMKMSHQYREVELLDPHQLQEALVNMLVLDMRNVDTLNDPGMTQFVRTVSGSMHIPSEKKIEELIRELHSDKLTSLADQLKMQSQMKPFSLGFEIWKNVENKHFLSIYYNYTTDAPDYNLLNQLYCTVEYNKFTSIDSIFEEFNLHNCSAAVVNYDYDDYLKHFLRNKNIPIILSYDVIVDKCLRDVFALPAVAAIIEEVKDVVMRYSSEISSKDVEIPSINDDFPWTYYELLKFFSDTVSWPEDVDILVSSAKAIADTLNPLAITLDTLKGEEIPHSSMLSPITAKILNKKLAVVEDDEFVSTIKSIITTELTKLVLSDDHLTISALLDPRFHRLTNVNNFNNCLQILVGKFNKLREQDGVEPPTVARETNIKPNTSSTRKSNLELFFDVQDTAEVPASREESNVENDLKRYRNEVYVSLDESPFLWWNKMGHMYGCLKQLASLYQCVPCVVNMNFKKPVKQQIYEHQKRYVLTGSLIDAILFLHDNTKCSY